MAWISVHESIDGGKLRKLYKTIGCSKFEATGVLVFFWFWGLKNADKDGIVVCADRTDIEDCISGSSTGCTVPANVIVDALFETGWIDSTPNGICIHDWDMWQYQWYKAMEKRERDLQRKRKGSQSKKDELEEPESKKRVTDSKTEKSVTKKTEYSTEFEAFWKVYPRREDRAGAYKKYTTRLKEGFSPDELIEAAERYAMECKKRHTDPEYIKMAKNFLSDELPFFDFIKKKALITPLPTTANPFENDIDD